MMGDYVLADLLGTWFESIKENYLLYFIHIQCFQAYLIQLFFKEHFYAVFFPRSDLKFLTKDM